MLVTNYKNEMSDKISIMSNSTYSIFYHYIYNMIMYHESRYLCGLYNYSRYKIRLNNSLIFYYLRTNIYNVYIFYNIKNKIAQYDTVYYIFNLLIKQFYIGISVKLNLIGRGYKNLNKSNLVFLKLGYPKLVYYTIPVTCRIWFKGKKKKKKKNFSILYSIGEFSYTLKECAFNIYSCRIPDAYHKKGIYIKNNFFLAKEYINK